MFILAAVTIVAGGVAAPLKQMSSERLVRMGQNHLDAGRRDSSVLCFAEVVQRYYKNSKDKGVRLSAVEAMRKLGGIYLSVDKNFEKAYEFTATALAIAEEDTLYAQLPYIYLSMAWLWDTSFHTNRSSDDKTAIYLKKAYRVAVKEHIHEALPLIATDMAVVDMTRERENFRSELSHFLKCRLPASIPLLTHSRLFVAAVQAMLRKDYGRAEALSHQAADAVTDEGKGARCHITAENMASAARAASGDLAGARRLLLRNLGYAKARPGCDDYLEGIYHSLMLNYKQAGMSDSARVFNYEYLCEKERMRQRNVPDMHELGLLHRIDRIDGDLRQMSIKKQEKERQLLWAIVAGAILVVIALGALVGWHWQRRYARELFHQNARLLEAEQQRRRERDKPKVKYGKQAMEESVTDGVFQSVMEVMETSSEIYTPGYTLARLSEQTGFKAYLVSQAVNEKTGGSVAQLLSAQRVKEASHRLASAEYDHLTIEAVAADVGMQSRSSFTRMFKTITGLAPAEFRRQAQAARTLKIKN